MFDWYYEKCKVCIYGKIIYYEVRKVCVETRVRVGGRFVKAEDRFCDVLIKGVVFV